MKKETPPQFRLTGYMGAGAPWAALGGNLTGSTIDEWTRQAGLDFEVERSAVMYQHMSVPTAGGAQHMMTVAHPGRDVLYRSDTFAPLGIMSKGYQIHQPKQVMALYGELADKGGFKLEAAGVLDGGAKIWALAQIGETSRVIGDDGAAPWLLLVTSFDGSLSTTGKFLKMRIACLNALHHAGARVTARIRHNQQFDPANIRDLLGIELDSWGTWLKEARQLAARELSGAEADDVLIKVLATKDTAVETIRDSQGYRSIMALFEGQAIGSELTGGRTAWQLLNSVTEFVDHHRGNSDNGRMKAAWFGKGDRLKSNAYALLTA